MKLEPMRRIGYEGANSTLAGLLTDNGSLIYARLLGYKSTNRAIWAASFSHDLTISDGTTTRRTRDLKYLSYSKQLSSGFSEMLIISSLAVPKYIPETETTFFVISRTETPDYNLFFDLLNRVSKVPLRKEWAEGLFDAILNETIIDADSYAYTCKGIKKLGESLNVCGWKVDYDEEQLLEHVKKMLKGGKPTRQTALASRSGGRREVKNGAA